MLVCEWVSLLYVCVWVGTDDLHFFSKKNGTNIWWESFENYVNGTILKSLLYYKGLCLFGLCLSVSLYLCISVAVSGDSVQIKSWVYSYWFADFVFEDWSYEIVILTFWIQMKCWCKLLRLEILILKLKFELKKGYCWNFNIIHDQKFGWNVLLIWPWVLSFQNCLIIRQSIDISLCVSCL